MAISSIVSVEEKSHALPNVPEIELICHGNFCHPQDTEPHAFRQKCFLGEKRSARQRPLQERSVMRVRASPFFAEQIKCVELRKACANSEETGACPTDW
jgi:hypothetical protein